MNAVAFRFCHRPSRLSRWVLLTVWLLCFQLVIPTLRAEPKQVRVFIALCDNKTQGIVPVGAKIGNGDDADSNLYWGCSDGFGSWFRSAHRWTVVKSEKDVSQDVLRRLQLRHESGEVELVAEAYRGSALRACLAAFEQCAAAGACDLAAFIGHNGLMDFKLQPPQPVAANHTEVIVLCCLSERYFGNRLRALGCRPRLMTQQLMYPGAFLLDAALESWRKGEDPERIRQAAARAYAKNQGISVRAAAGVFAPLTASGAPTP